MAPKKSVNSYAVNLDAPMPFPEDPSMCYMTVNVEEEICRPPGVHSLRQWGSMVLGEGKHRHKTFLEVVTEDRDYANWMKKHPKLSSEWATSFQGFVKAWDRAHAVNQNVTVMKPVKTSGKMAASSEMGIYGARKKRSW